MDEVDISVDPDLEQFVKSPDPTTQLAAIQLQTLREIQRMADRKAEPETPPSIPFRVTVRTRGR